MKKLAIIIGIAVASFVGPLAQGAGAMPADVTPVIQSSTVEPLPAVSLELGSNQRLDTEQTSQVPAGMTRDEYRALILRSEGLNQKYAVGNSVAPQGMTADEYRALILRSEGLNQKYGGSLDSLTLERGANQRFAADNNARGDLVDSTPSDTSPAFQWGDAGIGAGVLLGVVALIGAGLFEVRHHARLGTS